MLGNGRDESGIETEAIEGKRWSGCWFRSRRFNLIAINIVRLNLVCCGELADIGLGYRKVFVFVMFSINLDLFPKSGHRSLMQINCDVADPSPLVGKKKSYQQLLSERIVQMVKLLR